jgi:hypothetical protein
VGNRGNDLVGVTNLNEVAPQNRLAYAQTGDASLRPLNGIAGIGTGNVPLWTRGRNSIYHGLQLGMTSRFGRASQATASYTWSKSIANTGVNDADSGLTANNNHIDSTHPELDRSRGGNDRRHVFNTSVIFALPTFEDKGGFQKHVLGDWEVTSIVQAATGYPVDIIVGVPAGLDGTAGLTGTGYTGNQRPNVVEGQDCLAHSSNKVQWLNPAAWTIDGFAIGTNGNTGRNTCTGPGFFQWDAALYKNIKVGPKVQLQLRAEVFNITNRANFLTSVDANAQYTWTPQNVVYDTGNAATATTVVSATPAGNFGQLTRVADPRIVQLGIRLRF